MDPKIRNHARQQAVSLRISVFAHQDNPITAAVRATTTNTPKGLRTRTSISVSKTTRSHNAPVL